MRARITLAVVAILALALAIAGAVSFTLTRATARTDAEARVLSQAKNLVSSVNGSRQLDALIRTSSDSNEVISELLNLVQNVTRASATTLVVLSGGGLPAGASPTPLDAAQRAELARGVAVSGLQGGDAYGAARLVTICVPLSSTGTPVTAGSGTAGSGGAGGAGSHGSSGAAGGGSTGGGLCQTIGILLTEPVTYPNTVWSFVLAAAVALFAAGIVAALIARRISRHVVAAAGAAEAIASGDLEVRLPEGSKSYPELSALGSASNTRAAGLARARALERQFLLSISHDLRTPLTSIRGYAEAIADDAVPDPSAAAEIVVAEAARLERLIRDLLDLAYLDARQFSLRLRPVDLTAAVAAAAEAMRFELEASTVALEVVPPDEPLLVTADGDRLAQVVANLVENAGTYARSRVVVRVEREPAPAAPATAAPANRRSEPPAGGTPAGAVALSVEDDGPGIATDDLPHNFERLYTSERRPSRAARGTGLGLAIVAELTEAMGGSVHAVSPAGGEGGTRIVVRLPLQEPTVAAASRGGDTAP